MKTLAATCFVGSACVLAACATAPFAVKLLAMVFAFVSARSGVDVICEIVKEKK